MNGMKFLGSSLRALFHFLIIIYVTENLYFVLTEKFKIEE